MSGNCWAGFCRRTPTPRKRARSRFRLRPFIIRFCRWSATPMRARFRRPGLPLPQNRFRHPEDAREQLVRALDLHQKVFGVRPQGVWPSEGSVSEEVAGDCAQLGVKWMATDEGVLGRSTGVFFQRDGNGRLPRGSGGAALQHSSLREWPDRNAYGVSRPYDLGPDRLCVFRYGSGGCRAASDAQHQRRGAACACARARRGGVDHSRWRECLGILSEIRARISAAIL